jgi:hypothetical protein
MHGYSWGFITGVILLLTNQIVGWGGVALCAYLGKRTARKAFFAYGTGLYACSWVMLIAGVVLAGPEGIMTLKKLLKSRSLEALLTLAVILAGVTLYACFKKKKKDGPVVIPPTEQPVE